MNLTRRPWLSRPSKFPPAFGLALALLLIVVGVGTSPAAAVPRQQSTALTYRLADTWANEPWQLEAGRFREAADISSAPDGTIYILDDVHRAVHVLGPDGAPRGVLAVPDASRESNWVPRRIDVGFDGALHVLVSGPRPTGGGPFRSRVDRLTPDGQVDGRFFVEADVYNAFVDVAVRDDGRVYLSRNGRGNPFILWPGPTPTPPPDGLPVNGVDVFAADGQFQVTLAPPEMMIPGNLDVDADGTIFVINRVPSPWGEPPPGPTATPRPSLDRGAQRTQQGEVVPIEGVIVFEPDHRYRETVPFRGAEDIAVGPAGQFLSRGMELFALLSSEPFYIGQSGRVYAAYFDRVVFNLDASADGRLLTSMNHCYFQGLLIFDRPGDPGTSPRLVGANDAPYLEGPPYPLRVDASEQVAVLQGRFTASGEPPDRYYTATNYISEPQTVQRWTRQGEPAGDSRLRSQVGVCAGSDSWWTRDVAVDGTEIYTVDPNLVQMRPDDLMPAWTTLPSLQVDPDAATRLTAASADDGRVAVLDAGAAAVYVLDRAGVVTAHWSLAGADENALPVDIALHGDRVYLADLGRGRITARAADDGTVLGEWTAHDGPASIAVGPSGDVFLLGRGRWGFRYTPEGQLVASWPMPDRALSALDIGVDVDGHVYVSYIEREALGDNSAGRDILTFGITQSGVWVFEPAPAEPSSPPETGACVASPDKWAAPTRIPLGETVDVHLTVDGQCPGRYDPVQIVLVLDNSRSMNFNDALGRARDALSLMLAGLDPRAAEVGLVTFEEGASLVSPLSRDIASIGALAAAQDAWGDTLLAPAIELAHQELMPPNGDPSARRIILIVSDGVFNDQPLAAADAARTDGLELYGLIVPTSEFNQAHFQNVQNVIGNPNHMFVDPDPTELADLVDGMINYRSEDGLFETIRVEDEVPANMRYIVGSAEPSAAWDATSRTITWTLGRVDAADPIRLRYRLEPLEVGTWPTNVQATAPYRDVLGSDGTLVFPIPEVEVFGFDYAVFVPYGAAKACLRRLKPVDVVLVTDTSSSMAEPASEGGDTSTKLDAAKSAAVAFLDQLQWANDRASLVGFDRAARREVGLTGDRNAVVGAIAGLTTNVGTHIDLGLAEARSVLADDGRADAKPVVILMTDGLNNEGPDPVRAEAGALREAGVLVYTIGLGADVDAALLTEVATEPSGYYESPTAADLADIYQQISERLACDIP